LFINLEFYLVNKLTIVSLLTKVICLSADKTVYPQIKEDERIAGFVVIRLLDLKTEKLLDLL